MRFKRCLGFTIAMVFSLRFCNCLASNASTVIVKSGLPTFSARTPVYSFDRTPTLSLDFTIKSADVVVGNEANQDSIVNGGTYTGNASKVEGGYSYENVKLTADERRYIANTVQHEVGSYADTLDGNNLTCPSINVACVILNRYVSGYWEFPTTVQEVITQPYAFTGISGYWDRTDYASDTSYKAVDMALQLGDITGGCFWFRNKSITGWNDFFDGASTITLMFKDSAGHEFYKLKG